MLKISYQGIKSVLKRTYDKNVSKRPAILQPNKSNLGLIQT